MTTMESTPRSDPYTSVEVENMDGEKVFTDAWPSCSRHFVITRDLLDRRYFVITHLRSRSEMLGPFSTVRLAQLYAAVFAGLPIAWETFGPRSALGINHHAQERARFNAAWEQMPYEIRKWRMEAANDLRRRQNLEVGM